MIYPAIPNAGMPNWKMLSSIPIEECHEKIVPSSLSSLFKTHPVYYKMKVAHSLPECFVRSSVMDRLNKAASTLPDGIDLVLLDGWRPYPVQQYLFETLTNLLQKATPKQTVEETLEKARTIVSPPTDNPSNPSPHLTGGSVDVTLCTRDGKLLDMGTEFDEASDDSWTAALEQKENFLYSNQRDNRRMLYYAMTKAGFTNLPSEWWHYDFGNQLWALFTNNKKALYGATSTTSIEQMWKSQLTL
ncbi:M15 family metallopeptidase [Marinomonas spartinae]|uniref:M15 family metallopeptidase n=1 Tax=Marinomonas spartinae TaxID=1792290 RepID=UPI001F48BD62|nr:M15 family metallopeptidase [Marinomonas spartinae]